MNKVFTLVSIVSALFLTSAIEAAPKQYQLVGDHAQVVFSVDHFGFSKTHGIFKTLSGSMTFDEAKPESSKVDVIIKAASLETGSAARDQDLTGMDFLDAKKYPDIHFASTKIVKTAANNVFAVTGNLSMRGQTKPVTFNATLNKAAPDPFEKKPAVGFSGAASLKRSDFGITSYLPGISDDVNFIIDVEFGAPK